MDKRTFTQKFKMLLLIAFGLVMGQSMMAVDIVAFSLTTNGNATGGLPANSGATMTTNGVTSSSYSSSNGQTCYGWNAVGADRWETTSFSTAGYIQLTVVGQMKATGTGPRDFKGQYSLNGSTWVDIPNDVNFSDDNPLIVNPNTYALQSFKFRLPTACDNKATVYVRWVQNGTVSVDGGGIATGSGATASLKGVSVQGEAFAAPTSQASIISIVSVTPTTITVGCTRGTGNKRIIVMNTVNSFTDPVDNYNPSANTTYSSGQQVIYNGFGDQVTVNVPSSTNVYWFRYYDYNIMDALTRYNISTADGNPKQCKLENIHTPTAVYGLTRATLGATISTPTTGTIDERGVFWSLSPNVNTGGNQVVEKTNQGGVFALSVIGGVDRGSTIYYKGYVTNESGTILSEEASFSNVPVFTGTGSWSTASLWNVQEVPGANGDATYGSVEDSPIINGACTLTASNSCTDLTINSGKSLSINTGVELNVVGTLTNSAGTTGLVLKSAANQPNASLTWATGNPQATVEMYSKAYWDTKYHWQYFGTPITSGTVGSTFTGSAIVRKYDETNNDPSGNNVGLWDLQTSDATLVPVEGYEVVQPTATTYSFRGTLNHSNINKQIAYTNGADWAGNHILANPFTSAIDISMIDFGSAEQAVYIYNTGSLEEWQANSGSSTPGSNPGTYSVSTSGFAGIFGTPAQIPSMQGFLVQTPSTTTISIPYAAVTKNTVAQRAPKANANVVGTMIDVVSDKYSDRMWVFADPSYSNSFDNGYDGRKMMASALNTQLYGQQSDGEYQINAVSDLNNMNISFQSGQSTNFKLIFTHLNVSSNYSSLYLLDNVANKTVDISASGSEYAFTADPSGVAVNRFKIITLPTKVVEANSSSVLSLLNSAKQLVVNNKSNENGTLYVYTLDGALVMSAKFNSNAITSLPTSLHAGVYLVKAQTISEKITQRIIIR